MTPEQEFAIAKSKLEARIEQLEHQIEQLQRFVGETTFNRSQDVLSIKRRLDHLENDEAESK